MKKVLVWVSKLNLLNYELRMILKVWMSYSDER